MQIAAGISHPGSSTPIHYLNAKVNAFIFSTGVVPPAWPPPEGPILGRSPWAGDWPGQPRQGREGSHPLRGGATSAPGDKVQKAEQQDDTGDVGLDPTPSSALPCPRTWALRPHGPWQLIKGAGLPRNEGKGSVCAGTSAGGSRTLMAPVRAFLLLTNGFRHSDCPSPQHRRSQ